VVLESFLSIGAMENWGLVTYAESALLFNENTGTTGNREGVLVTIAHEFAVGRKNIIYELNHMTNDDKTIS
jgi:aminopeptidase N